MFKEPTKKRLLAFQGLHQFHEPSNPPKSNVRKRSEAVSSGLRPLSLSASPESEAPTLSNIWGPEDHINRRILDSGSKARTKGDSRNSWTVGSLSLYTMHYTT